MPKHIHNNKPEGWIMIFIGITGIASGFFVLTKFENLVKSSGTRTTRLLQWMVNQFGQSGTALIFIVLGAAIVFAGWRKLLSTSG